MAIPSGPALPWAVAVPEASGALETPEVPVLSRSKPCLAISDLDLHAGDKIEVEWHVIPENGEPYNRWWRATLMGPVAPETPAVTSPDEAPSTSTAADERRADHADGGTEAAAAPQQRTGPSAVETATAAAGPSPCAKAGVKPQPAPPSSSGACEPAQGPEAATGTAEGEALADSAGRPAEAMYEILYDSFEEFDQERATVCFTSKRRLLDSDQSGKMVWRKAGQEAAAAGDDSSDDDDDDGSDDDEGEPDELKHTFTLTEYADMCGTEEEGDADVSAMLSGLAPDKARNVAEAFLQFKEKLTSFISNKVTEREGQENSNVITHSDVQEFMARMMPGLDVKRRRLQ